MSKLKQSISILRQIPEHIRNNYPVFTEFLRVYYQYLEETQQLNLESLHSIDSVTDEFIDRFKSELSKNFPIHLVGDKRLVLKHLREFYLSRGSEASYKFLFRALFGKESSLFYPSQRILRASDGRWIQDTSVFVKPLNQAPSVTDIIGKFAYITNPNGKTLRVYVSNASKYNSEIFEVFIDHDYAIEIEIGATILDESGVYKGEILACPSSIKVYKGGKGFSVGDVFSLKTQLGRGCVIKVTKVDSQGSIKKIQVIKFGLDYRTKFYSYLSNKQIAGQEYVHPLKIGSTPSDPAYNDPTNGFADYGWASKQTYFHYDSSIPVGDESMASDRYYADSTYVGEVVQQFYNDASLTIADEDVAIIEIDLGAAAKYPGYYETSDGFISDEIFIQDGYYYQAFSYVIRVEEELRRYADIIKTLLHPAGMKVFSEFNIYNELKLEYSDIEPLLSLVLPREGSLPSSVVIDDRGYSYNSYDTSIQNGEVVVTPSAGAQMVFSRQSKAALRTVKKLLDSVSTPDQIRSTLEKRCSDTINTSMHGTIWLNPYNTEEYSAESYYLSATEQIN